MPESPSLIHAAPVRWGPSTRTCTGCWGSGGNEALALAAGHALRMGLKAFQEKKKEGKSRGLEPAGGFRLK